MVNFPSQQGIARICSVRSGAVLGTAFLISPRLVITCAHVVNDAVEATWDSVERPNQSVQVEFPFMGNDLLCAASVVEWRAPGHYPAADIAVLQLDIPEDISLPYYRMISSQVQPGQSFWTKGFPAGQDSGMDASGTIGTRVEFGRLLAHGEGTQGFFIESGFSGAPLFDVLTGAVLGMAAEATRDAARRIAFVIPSDQLERAYPPIARPYKGLAAFQEDDARFFYGRERYVNELATKLARLPLVAVIGRSGSGKSSLVRAGLIPRLRKEGDWHVVTLRPGSPTNDPLRNLVTALQDELEGPPSDHEAAMRRQDTAIALAAQLTANPMEIVARLNAIARVPGRHEQFYILLVIDQFEELFTSVSDRAELGPEYNPRERFVRCLRAAASNTQGPPAAQCVLTIRADYMGRALELGELADALADADVKLGPMNEAELRRAIEAPAEALDVKFDVGLADELARTVAARPDTLPLLEFTLADLWSNQRERTIRRTIPHQGHGSVLDAMSDALERHAEAIFTEISRLFTEMMVRKVIMDMVWLADPKRGGEDTRRTRQHHEFSKREWELIEQLAGQDRRARLVTIGANEIDGEATAEIVHEALIHGWARLHSWLEEDRAFRVWFQKMEDASIEWLTERDNAYLLTGKRLAEAQTWWSTRDHRDMLSIGEYIVTSLSHNATKRLEDIERLRSGIVYELRLTRVRGYLSERYEFLTFGLPGMLLVIMLFLVIENYGKIIAWLNSSPIKLGMLLQYILIAGGIIFGACMGVYWGWIAVKSVRDTIHQFTPSGREERATKARELEERLSALNEEERLLLAETRNDELLTT
jgi:hypothetical protein